jgi:hypothetical protein
MQNPANDARAGNAARVFKFRPGAILPFAGFGWNTGLSFFESLSFSHDTMIPGDGNGK